MAWDERWQLKSGEAQKISEEEHARKGVSLKELAAKVMAKPESAAFVRQVMTHAEVAEALRKLKFVVGDKDAARLHEKFGYDPEIFYAAASELKYQESGFKKAA